MNTIKVAIVDNSYIIRKGIFQLLHEFSNNIEIVEFDSHLTMERELRSKPISIIIINTQLLTSYHSKDSLLIFAKQILSLSLSEFTKGDLNVNDSKAEFLHTIDNAISRLKLRNEPESETEELTIREKLVLQQVSLGLQNKEIADKLSISTHTVITHRKNITRKLGIKTVSGLTIYALLNKLISLDEIKL